MTSFLLILGLTALFGIGLANWTEWWAFAPAAFVVGLWRGRVGWKTFLAGFAGVFFVWLALAAWLDSMTMSKLSDRVALILPLGGSNWKVYAVTLLLGPLVGGLAALSGFLLRWAATHKRDR